jgi:hypothetical protein
MDGERPDHEHAGGDHEDRPDRVPGKPGEVHQDAHHGHDHPDRPGPHLSSEQAEAGQEHDHARNEVNPTPGRHVELEEEGKPDAVAVGKLKAMGSATASSGAVGLYHVENVTPEAIEQGRDLLVDDYQTHVIDDAEFARVRESLLNRWKDPQGDPTAVYIGCPHNTYYEMVYWSMKLDHALKDSRQEMLAIPVVMASAVVVRDRLLDQHPILYRDMLRAGVQFTNICAPAYQGLKGMADIDRGVTNSNKARFYTRLRLYDDDDLVQIALTGRVPY